MFRSKLDGFCETCPRIYFSFSGKTLKTTLLPGIRVFTVNKLLCTVLSGSKTYTQHTHSIHIAYTQKAVHFQKTKFRIVISFRHLWISDIVVVLSKKSKFIYGRKFSCVAENAQERGQLSANEKYCINESSKIRKKTILMYSG